jgi:hypothetical protein
MILLPRFLSCALAACVVSAAAVAAPEPTQERKQKIQEVEAQATAKALERKHRSDELLRREGVPVNKYLPAIEDETQVKVRTREEIAFRALALLTVSMKGAGLDNASVQKLVEGYGLTPRFTPDERRFIRNATPSERDRVQFSWRYEAAWVLLWSIGYVDDLGKPAGSCDVDAAIAMMRKRSATQFVADAKLRPLSDIVEQADRIYRYHWAVVEANVSNGKLGGLDPDVTMERHHALNWLIGYMDADWDDVSTDT